MNTLELSTPDSLGAAHGSARFGVAYRKEKTAWKIAPYPLRATPGSARKLIEWLKNTSAGKDCEMRVVSIALLPNADLRESARDQK